MAQKTPIIILAAGESARLGQPKQLLPFKETTLIHYIVDECIQSQVGEVFVILGAYANAIEEAINDLSCEALLNINWKEGMGSSIASGVAYIQSLGVDGVYVVLGDQPYFQKSLLLELASKKEDGLVISKYKEGMGPPVYFDKRYFSQLAKLKGEEGARKIIQAIEGDITSINFPLGHLDIDREEDLERLK